MKKLTALLLSLMLCFLMASAFAEDVDAVGVWYLSHALYNGVDCPVVDSEAITLTLSENGTFIITASYGTVRSAGGNWSVSGSTVTLTEDDQPLDCEIVDGEMVIDTGSIVLYLSGIPAEPVELPGSVPAESPYAFSGTWESYATISAGLLIPRDENTPALNSQLVIDGESVRFITSLDGTEPEEILYEYTFGDGVLTVEEDLSEPVIMTFSLREDGSLFVTTRMDSSEGTVFELTTLYAREGAGAQEIAEGPEFVTVQEWLDAKGECGDCLMLLEVQEVINPVLAVVADETGTVNLYSGREGEPIVWLMNDEQNLSGYWIVIANPRYNEFEGTVELADWTLLRMIPGM